MLRLLVSSSNEFDRAFEQGVHNIDVLLAGHTEHVLDMFILETFYK
jgi:hypothetical protein